MTGEYILWYYTPSLVAAVVLVATFALVTTAHAIRLIQTRAYFCTPLVIGGIFEAFGYGARAVAHFHTAATLPYALQSLLILLGPILFAASVYMILGRLIRMVDGEQYSCIRSRWLTKVFVAGDVTCFLIQGGGGGILSGAKTQSTIDLGQYVILAGLVLQILCFALFVVVAAIFHVRARRDLGCNASGWSWPRQLAVLYFISVLISGRNVFRVIEYAWGSSGYLLRHEWTLYTFDGALMATVLSVCLLWYSIDFARSNKSITEEHILQ